MEDFLLDVLSRTAEYQTFLKYGWFTVALLPYLGVIVTTPPEFWGLWEQGKTVWEKRSADSISVPLFTYTVSFFVACGVYGIHLKTATGIGNAIGGALFHIPILWGILRFKGFTKWEWVLTAVFILMPVSIWYADGVNKSWG